MEPPTGFANPYCVLCSRVAEDHWLAGCVSCSTAIDAGSADDWIYTFGVVCLRCFAKCLCGESRQLVDTGSLGKGEVRMCRAILRSMLKKAGVCSTDDVSNRRRSLSSGALKNKARPTGRAGKESRG